MDNKLSICQWNIRGFQANKSYLEYLINAFSLNIFVLQETFLAKEKNIAFQNFNIFRKDRDYKGGGVMIGIKNFVPSFEIKLQTDLEVIAVQIFSKPKNITVCNIYIPPSLNDAVEQLEKVIKQLPKDNPLSLLGDFNAHHALWDSPQNNARGEKLYELIEGRGMILLNESVPTFVCDLNGQTSTLDLSVTTSDLLGEFMWSTFKNTLGSDHYPILMFASALCTMREKKPKWIIDDSKWVEFENNLKLPDIDITKDINYINNSIVEPFTRIATNTFKLSSSKIVQKRYKAWWSKDCERAIKEKNKMFRIFKAHPIMQNQI